MLVEILEAYKERAPLTDLAPSDNLTSSSSKTWHPQLSVCLFILSEEVAGVVESFLDRERYVPTYIKSAEAFLTYLEGSNHPDCLVFEVHPQLLALTQLLKERAIFLPTVILDETSDGIEVDGDEKPTPSNQVGDSFLYHVAEVHLEQSQYSSIGNYIEQAITEFLNLTATSRLTSLESMPDLTTTLTTQSLLYRQQRRLAEKLRERLGYLGVYYKRNPQIFLRNLPPTERHKFLDQLKANYYQIVLNYFSQDPTLNNKIDEFVNLAFFADVPVTQIVEIHMELMDEFSKQLKLEGRSDEVLLDYRLTLIDTIAHLCEMYRRSIPRES